MASAQPFSFGPGPNRRASDRRMDDRVRAGVEQLARALLLECWRDHAELLRVEAPDGAGDERLDAAVAVLLGDREFARGLRTHVEQHEAGERLRLRARDEAAHAPDYTHVDVLDRLSNDPDPKIAEPARATRIAMANRIDPFGGPVLPASALGSRVQGLLLALGAVLREQVDAGVRGQVDRAVEEWSVHASTATAAPDPAVALADALAAQGRLDIGVAMEALAAGHMPVWLATAARLLARAPDRLSAAMTDPALPPALARLLAPDPLAGARLLLLLARAAVRDDDLAGEQAAEWVDRYGDLETAAAEAVLDERLRSPAYAAAIARAEALR